MRWAIAATHLTASFNEVHLLTCISFLETVIVKPSREQSAYQLDVVVLDREALDQEPLWKKRFRFFRLLRNLQAAMSLLPCS